MKNEVQVHDKIFVPFITAAELHAKSVELGQKINHAPRTAAQYAANRLHLIPQEFADKVPQAPDLDEDIEESENSKK